MRKATSTNSIWRELVGTAGSKSQSCLILWIIVNWEEPGASWETSTFHQLEDGDGRMSDRQSDSFIVLKKPGNADGGKGAI